MRIYDSDNDKTIDNVTLYLTVDEARELYDDLAGLIERPAVRRWGRSLII